MIALDTQTAHLKVAKGKQVLIDKTILIDTDTSQSQYCFVQIFFPVIMSDKCQLILTIILRIFDRVQQNSALLT